MKTLAFLMLVGRDGFEPSTNWLKANCSTTELTTRKGGYSTPKFEKLKSLFRSPGIALDQADQHLQNPDGEIDSCRIAHKPHPSYPLDSRIL